jgi:hypothetical protein
MTELPKEPERKDGWKAFTEEIEVSGQNLLQEINRIIAEGNVRKIQIKSDDGDLFLAVPLTAGVVAGGIVALAAPWLAVIAAIAGLVTRVKLEIVRDEPEERPTETLTRSETSAPVKEADTSSGPTASSM